MQTLWQDVRFGARMLVKKPGFTFIAVLTLALGIGANTAIFSVLDGVLFRSLPYPHADRLVFLWGQHAQQGKRFQQVSYPDFADIREQNEVFDDVAAIFGRSWTLSKEEQSERVNGLLVSPSIFRLLGVEAAVGRTFLPEEEQPGKGKVVILSHRLWANRFGSDTATMGKSITVNGENLTVVGVMPKGFDLEFPLDAAFSIADNDLWMPLPTDHPMASRRAVFTYEVVARLKPGVTLEQARSNLAVIGQRLKEAYPETNETRSFAVISALDQIVGNVRPVLLLLLAAVGTVLLVACVNIANLLMGRAAARQQEIAIRAALGASVWRIMRQLLTESLLLAVAGGLAGLLVASWTVSLLIQFPDINLPRIEEISIDGRVMGFTLGLSLLTGLLFGLLPALIAARRDFQSVLKEGGQKVISLEHRRSRSLLIVSQLALAFVLLVSAGLLTRSLSALLRVNPGFRTENLLTFAVSPPAAKYTQPKQIAEFYRGLKGRIENLPGVQSAGVVSSLPLSGHNTGSALRIESRPLQAGEQPLNIGWQTVLPGYFGLVGIPIVQGRDFQEEDFSRSAHVTIISESLAGQVFPGEDPIGKRITYGAPGLQTDWHEIIGIAGDVHHRSLDEQPNPRGYDLLGQHGGQSMFVVIRTDRNPADLANAARTAVHEVEPGAPVFLLATMDDLLSRTTATRRFSLMLVGGFALVALLMAAIGIYGVLNYAVRQRTREIGIRLAMGAQPRDVLKLIIGQGARLIGIGVSVGLLGALALTRLMESLLFEVSAADLLTFVAVALLLTLVALLACWIPARRAMKVSPMTALRYE